MSAQRISGIYAIVHAQSGRQYIGSSGHIHKRWREHQHALREGKHDCIYLQRIWNKYGPDSLIWQVLEECDTSALTAREQLYLNRTPNLLNTSPEARSPQGVKHRPEVVEAMRQRVKAAYAESDFALRHRQAQKRRFEDPVQREAIQTRNAGIYRVTRPDGEVLVVQGITRFCKEQGLSVTQMAALARGARVKPYKGWNCETVKPSLTGQAKRKHQSYVLPTDEGKRRAAKAFIARAPTGEFIEGRNLAEFARSQGLDEFGLRSVAARRQAHHARWVIRWQDDVRGDDDFIIPARRRGVIRHYLLTDPSGQQYRTDSLVVFASQHGLRASTLVDVARNRRRSCRGWSCAYAD